MSGEEHVYGLDGIKEGDNKFPKWLIFVYVGLLSWGIYYLFAYWTIPGDEVNKEALNSPITYSKAREEGFVASAKEDKKEEVKAPSAEDAGKAKLVADGKVVFEANCAGCHGIAGDGNGPAAAALNPKPRNFVEAKFKYPPNATDADLTVTIQNGVKGSAMPAWKDTLNADQIKSVIAYVRTFHKS